METDKVLNFYDGFWFQSLIFEKEPTFSFRSISEANPDGENGVKLLEQDQGISMSGSVSLKSLFSETDENLEENPKTAPFKEALKKTRRKGCERKSQLELEFEEVKGFRDLGFVFTEEDRNSMLASVIPGLNKLGLEETEKEDVEKEIWDESRISRPYLSEVWEVLALDRKREEINPLLKNWKLPSLSSETDMKENLRWWAHIVASNVR